MRNLAIGDVHGCLTALETVLTIVQPQKDDRLFFLGDYVDRGPDARGVIDRILQLRQQHEVTCLIGNHEIMMLTAREDQGMYLSWLGYGGEETLASYADDDAADGSLDLVPERHWQFLESICQPYFETDDTIFVHANVLPEVPLDRQDETTLFWNRFTNRGPHRSGKKVICGHTSQKSGLPLDVGHSIVIDTWVYGDGWLTCLDVDSGHFCQGNQAGKHRLGVLA
ncbi:metallophosphoesterase family protein [Bremerella sp. JC817]|uniref:metallophosphoesterase family protein n=1 Tax=Bremerella sp. JC817 TaxID=3231756 RepID=UPI00345850BE